MKLLVSLTRKVEIVHPKYSCSIKYKSTTQEGIATCLKLCPHTYVATYFLSSTLEEVELSLVDQYVAKLEFSHRLVGIGIPTGSLVLCGVARQDDYLEWLSE